MRLKEKCSCGRTDWCGFDKRPCVELIPLGHRVRLGLSLPEAQDPPASMANKPADMANSVANSMANTGSDMANAGESMANRSAYQYRDPEARRAYMREYMARRRAQKKSPGA